MLTSRIFVFTTLFFYHHLLFVESMYLFFAMLSGAELYWATTEQFKNAEDVDQEEKQLV